jgi:ELWxxDGT repeat protein
MQSIRRNNRRRLTASIFPGSIRLKPLVRHALMLLASATLVLETAAAQTARRIVSTNGDPILYPSYLKEYDGRLCFRANNLPAGNNVELWAFDGTAARMVADINPGTTGSDPSYLAACNGKLYFCATGPGGASKLWQYDAVNGASLAPGSAAQASLPQDLFAYGGSLYFRASRFSDIGVELWKFDGVSQTPINLFPGSGSSYPQHFIEYNGLMYFNACGTTNQGTELWSYTGTGLPTEAARIYPNNGSSPESFVVYNGQLYFSAYDGVHGRELWRYDGTNATLAADLVPGGPASSSNPNGMTVYKGKLYFSATDGMNGYEFWSFDGTTAQLVADLNPTPNPGNGDDWLMDSSPGDFTVCDDLLYFSANDGVHGRELWSYDGATTRLVLDINPGPYGSEVSELTVYNGTLYFSADDGYSPGLSGLEPKIFALEPAPLTLEEALDTTGVVWTTGSHPWLAQTEVTHDAVDAAQSGQVHNADDHSWLKATNLIGPGTVSFRWKASLDCGAFTHFGVSYGSGVWPQAVTLSASTDWRWETCFFGPGPQELVWTTYGNCDQSDQATVWLDEVVLTGPGHEAAPFFTTQPASLIVPAGTNVTFQAVAAGYPIPTLQWQANGQDVPGATNFVLALTNVQQTDAGLYAVVADNPLGRVTNTALLTVQESAPVILMQQADQVVTHGLAARFQVVPQGTVPLQCQWQFNGVNLAGETNATLVLDPVSANQAGLYSVVIRNPIGTQGSRQANLTVVNVAAWGEDAYGQTQVPSNACDVVAIAAGSGHSLALKRDGTILAWGDTNWNAQTSIPPDATNITALAAGGWHSLAVRSSGAVVSWGYNGDHQTNAPTGLAKAVAVAGGLRHSLALLADGRVLAWGYEPAAQPTAAASLHDVAAIAAGSLHNLALRSNGTVFAWGDNSLGQRNVPDNLSNVVAVAAGSGHSLALKSDGSVAAWGTNGFAQATVPEEATNVVRIAAGDQHNLALRADGVLLAWGDSRYGQTAPPAGLAGVTAIAAGRAHSVALLGAIPPAPAPTLFPDYFPASSRFSVSVPTVRGRTYFLETKDSLSGSDWVAVSVVFGDGVTKVFTDSAGTALQRFYRVQVK